MYAQCDQRFQRRVRKDPIEDQKCDAVANLLIQGASGDQLETEVKETLAQQAPEPVAPEQIKLVNKRGRRSVLICCCLVVRYADVLHINR